MLLMLQSLCLCIFCTLLSNRGYSCSSWWSTSHSSTTMCTHTQTGAMLLAGSWLCPPWSAYPWAWFTRSGRQKALSQRWDGQSITTLLSAFALSFIGHFFRLQFIHRVIHPWLICPLCLERWSVGLPHMCSWSGAYLWSLPSLIPIWCASDSISQSIKCCAMTVDR